LPLRQQLLRQFNHNSSRLNSSRNRQPQLSRPLNPHQHLSNNSSSSKLSRLARQLRQQPQLFSLMRWSRRNSSSSRRLHSSKSLLPARHQPTPILHKEQDRLGQDAVAGLHAAVERPRVAAEPLLLAAEARRLPPEEVRPLPLKGEAAVLPVPRRLRVEAAERRRRQVAAVRRRDEEERRQDGGAHRLQEEGAQRRRREGPGGERRRPRGKLLHLLL
jgi:hypothetical protein